MIPGKVVTVDTQGHSINDIVDPYHSNVTEPIIGRINGQDYYVPFNLKTAIHNHSPNVAMFYSSETAVSLTFNLRIQQDISLAPDREQYDYEDYGYGSSVPTRSWSGIEPHNGLGANQLPRDGNRYFLDAHNILLKGNGGSIGVAGSVQSDRMTCYKTTSCKFD
jgi:hypothetical protein